MNIFNLILLQSVKEKNKQIFMNMSNEHIEENNKIQTHIPTHKHTHKYTFLFYSEYEFEMSVNKADNRLMFRLFRRR